MSFLFKKKKSGNDLIKSTRKHLEVLSSSNIRIGSDDYAHSLDKMTQNLNSIKLSLYGDTENEPNEENNNKLCELLFICDTNINSNNINSSDNNYNNNMQHNHSNSSNSNNSHNLLLLLLYNIKKFEFEARKDVAQIFTYLLRHHKTQSVHYIQQHSDILRLLIDGYNDTDIALNCGAILREIIRHEELCSLILNNLYLMNNLFELVQLNTFDIASDAFATFKLLLTKHKRIAADWLNNNFTLFCNKYSILLQNGNYVTKRQSLKLLGELLLARSNFNVMMMYINSSENLKIMMNLLRGNTRQIQYEAFHVFKIFVANPRKSTDVCEILVRNKYKLIDFLHKFKKDKENDQLFEEEKQTLIKTLQNLQPPPGSNVVPATVDSNDNTSSHNTLNLSISSMPQLAQQQEKEKDKQHHHQQNNQQHQQQQTSSNHTASTTQQQTNSTSQ